MLVLTLLQPYAWMVVHGTKDLENRSWCNQRTLDLMNTGEPFAIHAASKLTRAYYAAAVAFAEAEDSELVVPAPEELVLGAILGTAVIVNVHPPSEWVPFGQRHHIPWHMKEQFGWSLLHRTPLPEPVPWKGMQGFWSVPDELLGKAA